MPNNIATELDKYREYLGLVGRLQLRMPTEAIAEQEALDIAGFVNSLRTSSLITSGSKRRASWIE